MIDFSKQYSIDEFDLLFSKCPYCNLPSIKCLYNDASGATLYVQYNVCVSCNFAARFFFIPAMIDLIFHMNNSKHINLIVSSKGVRLVEKEKTLKVLSHLPIFNLNELKDLLNKYIVLF
jgi:hypothetical protein